MCMYTILNGYSYIRPVDASGITNPGYYTEGEWYDENGRRFYLTGVYDGSAEFLDDIDRVTDDTVFRLKWIGVPVKVIPVDNHGVMMEGFSFIVGHYGEPYGPGLDAAAAHLIGEQTNLRVSWEVAKKTETGFDSIGTTVYAETKVLLDNFNDVIDTETEPGKYRLYVVARVSDDYITVHLKINEVDQQDTETEPTIDEPTDFNVIGITESESGSTTYEFSFNEGHRIGHYLYGWKFLDESNAVHYVMGESVKVVKDSAGTYTMYYIDSEGQMDARSVDVRDGLTFEAVWKPILYSVEVHPPTEGKVLYKYTVDGVTIEGSVEAHQSAVTIFLKYGSEVEFDYQGKAGSPNEFYRWRTVGEGAIVEDEDSNKGYLTVEGAVAVSSILMLKSGYELKVYDPKNGEIIVSIEGEAIPGEQHPGYVKYNIANRSGASLRYMPDDSNDSMGCWIYNNNMLKNTNDLNLLPQSFDVTVRPYLKLNTESTLTDVYAAVRQNAEGSYTVEVENLPTGIAGSVVVASVPSVDTISVSAWSWEEQTLFLTISGLEEARGTITVDLVLDGPQVAAKLKTTVFIVGPIVDGGL